MTYQFFPRSQGLNDAIAQVVACFKEVDNQIRSDENDLNSNAVLQILNKPLTKIGYRVEAGKKTADKIPVPVLFGKDNKVDKEFNADAISADGRVVIEIEAGRAIENNQYLKDVFQACMMFGVEYLVLAVRIEYRRHRDFERVYAMLETLYLSNRLRLPLAGILLIGY